MQMSIKYFEETFPLENYSNHPLVYLHWISCSELKQVPKLSFHFSAVRSP